MSEVDDSKLTATPCRVRGLCERLAGRDAEAQVLSASYKGQLGGTGKRNTVTVDATEIIIPETAVISKDTRGGRVGIQINSDFEPAPSGTCLWVSCVAVGEAHEVFDELAALSCESDLDV